MFNLFLLACQCFLFVIGLDDNHGDRTVNAIPNVHGIVKFQAGFISIKSGEPSKMTSLGQEEKYKVIRTRTHTRTHTYPHSYGHMDLGPDTKCVCTFPMGHKPSSHVDVSVKTMTKRLAKISYDDVDK